jgi:biopolymer transport protein ExbD
MRAAPVVAVSAEWIALEGEAMLTVADAARQETLLLRKLHAGLVALRQRTESADDPRIVVQGDRGIEFKVLQRVLYTSQMAGYTQVSLAVLQGDSMVLSQSGSPNGKP